MAKRKQTADRKTLAMRLLATRGVAFEARRYDPSLHVAHEVAEAIGLPAEQMYKTLVVQAPQPGAKPLLVMVPADDELDLKALARQIGCKRLLMASRQQAERLTGLVAGGISALALIHHGFEMWIDIRALNQPLIGVSAGERGIAVVLSPDSLIGLTGAQPVSLEAINRRAVAESGYPPGK
jgi:Cys-tRNA(Pro)/Cys-tRNA(Cys) deacylase